VNDHEAAEMLRLAGGLEREDWNQVKSARMEVNGEPSVLLQEWAREAQRSDLELVRRRRKESGR